MEGKRGAEGKRKCEWHTHVYTGWLGQTWSSFFYANALFQQTEIKNKIWTLKRKEYVFLHSVLSSTYFVCVSIFKVQPPTAGDCCFFFVSGSLNTQECQTSSHTLGSGIHSVQEENVGIFFLCSGGLRVCLLVVGFCLFFIWTKWKTDRKGIEGKKKKKKPKNQTGTSLLSSKSCSGPARWDQFVF